MRAEPDGQATGLLLVLVSTLAFAVGPTAAKLSLDNGGDTLTVVTLRGVVGAALMAALVLLTRQSFRVDRRAWRWCLYSGLCTTVTVYAFIGALAYLPVSSAVLIFFTHPLLIAVIAHHTGGDRLTWRKLVLALAVFLGLSLALGPDFGDLSPLGIALAALASVSVCVLVLTAIRAQVHATSTQVSFYGTAISGVLYGLVALALQNWVPPHNTIGWLGILGAGFGIAVGLLTFYAALRHLSSVRVTMLSSVEPLFSILLAAVVLGERLGWTQWLGVALVIGALILFEAAGRARETAA